MVSGVGVVGAADSAASLAAERVTLRDMSNGSHQVTLSKDRRKKRKVFCRKERFFDV